LGLAVVMMLVGTGQTMAGTGERGTPSLMDRLQKDDDPELAELIRTALANHKGVSEKEAREIVRRVVQGRTQILLLDQQIEDLARKIEAKPASAKRENCCGQEGTRSRSGWPKWRICGSCWESFPVSFQERPKSLNTWLSLNVVDERVVVLDTVRVLRLLGCQCYKVAGLLPEETLDYVRGQERLKRICRYR
jgi:hypothetical protein